MMHKHSDRFGKNSKILENIRQKLLNKALQFDESLSDWQERMMSLEPVRFAHIQVISNYYTMT